MTSLVAESTSKSESLDLLPAFQKTLELALSLWPLWLLVALVVLGRVAAALPRRRRLARSGIREIDAMDGRTFEEFLATLFRRLSYQVELTRLRGDYGADLVATRGRTRLAVQAKRRTQPVGVKAVQEVVAAKAYYGCDGAVVVTNRTFTHPARKLARANGVELWGRDELVSKLLSARRAGTGVPSPAPPREHAAPRRGSAPAPAGCCARCGDPVTEAVRDYCLSRPARFRGFVYCFQHQRSISARARDPASR